MARDFEMLTATGHRVSFQASQGGLEIVLYDGKIISEKWRPVWPGDHTFTVTEDGESVEYTIKGHSVGGTMSGEFEWRVRRDGAEILRVR